MFALPYEMSQSCFLNNYKIIYLFLKNYSAFQKFLTGKKCAYCSAMIMTCSLEELRVLINSPALLTLAVKQTSVVGCLVLHVYLVGFLEHALPCCCHSNHIVSVIVRQSCCCWAFPFPPHSCAKVSFKKDCQTEVSVMFHFEKQSVLTFSIFYVAVSSSRKSENLYLTNSSYCFETTGYLKPLLKEFRCATVKWTHVPIY